MRKIIKMCTFILLTSSVFAQAPNKISYQAVIRDNSNTLVVNQAVGIRISVLQGSPSGVAVYVETHTPTTNTNGLVSIEIGGGTIVSGNFSTIDWINGPYFVQTETDPAGGVNYSITGTSQLLSVPYAFHAKTAETVAGGVNETDPIFQSSVAFDITGTDVSNWNNKQEQVIAGTGINITGNTISVSGNSSGGSLQNDFYIGQDTLGGIVFHIYWDENGNQKGYILHPNMSNNIPLRSNTIIQPSEITNIYDGEFNTSNLVDGLSPAKQYVNNLGPEWFIPSIDEVILLGNNRHLVSKALIDAGYQPFNITNRFWTSTMLNATGFYYTLNGNSTGMQQVNSTSNNISVRAVKKF